MVEEDVFIPYTVQGIIGDIRSRMRVLSEAYDEKGVKLRVRSNPEELNRIKTRLSTQAAK